MSLFASPDMLVGGQVPMETAGRLLSEAVADHMAAHLAAHGASSIKPKHHWMFDIAGQLSRQPVVIDCFVVERLHLRVKPLAEQVQNTRRFEKSVMSSVLTAHGNSLREAHFCNGGLLGPTSPLPGTTASVADALEVSGLRLAVGDVVWSPGRCGETLACCREADALLLIVRLWREMAPISPHSGWYERTAELAVGLVGPALCLALAWRSDENRLLVVRR